MKNIRHLLNLYLLIRNIQCLFEDIFIVNVIYTTISALINYYLLQYVLVVSV